MVTWACRLAQKKNISAGRWIVRKLNVRKLKHTVNKVLSLSDLQGQAAFTPQVTPSATPAVNKVLSLRDFARHSGENDKPVVFIDFYCFYIIINIHCTEGVSKARFTVIANCEE
jgi:hypothetical protein